MKRFGGRGFGRVKVWKFECAVLLGCVLVPVILLSIFGSSSECLSILSLQLSIPEYMRLSTLEPSSSDQEGIEMVEVPIDMNENQVEESSKEGIETIILPQNLEEAQGEKKSIAVDADRNVTGLSLDSNEIQKPNDITSGNPIEEHKMICDFTEPRSDTCTIHGDVRILGNSSSIILYLPTQRMTTQLNTSLKIRPYARKWEPTVMKYIKEITLESSSHLDETPRCTVTHKIPAVVFSTGGFLGNFFHDFTDVLIPLFVTSRKYDREVQFLVTDFNSKWIDKYQLILKQLSQYEITNLDSDTEVHCFQQVHVGLLSHKVLGIDPTKSPNGYSMTDFREFLRACLSLNKRSSKSIEKQSRKKARLLFLLRNGSRSLTNGEEVTKMARSIGYKVIAAGPEETKNYTEFARVVNSCDLMIGVHGAGLTNMIFLPTNATLIQIVPWGGLKWACRHDFGEPATDMGVRYLEYEIKEEESSLIDEYPRDHPVLRDPDSIHRLGWNALWSVFLSKQKVKLDIPRFRSLLLEVRQSLRQ